MARKNESRTIHDIILTMKAQEVLLQQIEEIERRLARLKAQVQGLPDIDAIGEPDYPLELNDSNDIENVFETLREIWQIDLMSDSEIPAEEMQAAMTQDMPANWASQEIQRMREE